MHKLTALFFVLLFSYNMIYSFNIERYRASTIRGKLTQIMVEVKVTQDVNTVKKFLSVLRDMLDKLVSDQEKHREINVKMMKQCTEEAQFREKEIADAKDALARGLSARNKCQVSLDASRKNLPELENTLKTYQDELERATKQREVEHKKYLEVKGDYTEAITFLGGFIEYVNEKFKGKFKAFSFAELSEKVLFHSAKLNTLEKSLPVLLTIANLPAHTNYAFTPAEEQASNLKDALHNLLETLKKDLEEVEKVEEERQRRFEVYSNKLNAVIHGLEESIRKTKEQIEAMEKCVKEETAVIDKASAKLERNSGLKEDAAKMCDNFAKEFIDATNNRLEEIKAVRQILEIVKRRIGELPADLVAYLDEVENGWRKYKNSTEFQKFKEYAQQHTNDNEHGGHLSGKGKIEGEVVVEEHKIESVGF